MSKWTYSNWCCRLKTLFPSHFTFVFVTFFYSFFIFWFTVFYTKGYNVTFQYIDTRWYDRISVISIFITSYIHCFTPRNGSKQAVAKPGWSQEPRILCLPWGFQGSIVAAFQGVLSGGFFISRAAGAWTGNRILEVSFASNVTAAWIWPVSRACVKCIQDNISGTVYIWSYKLNGNQ